MNSVFYHFVIQANRQTEFDSRVRGWLFRKGRCLAIATVLVAGFQFATPPPATAQTEGSAKQAPAKSPLAVGDASPAFQVEAILKGDKLASFEKGKVYVVEFWATWCGPCIQMMPHLSELQARYKDDGLTIVGTNVRELRRSGGGWEEAFDEAARAKVESFVKQQGDQMAYTVAYDGAAKVMDRAWLGSNLGLPTAFIVDRQGRIAWIGHPLVLRMPLDSVVEGTWNLKTGPERVKKAEDAYIAALRLLASDGQAGLEAWDQAAKDYPVLANDLIGKKFDALIAAGLCDAASAAGKVLLAEAVRIRDARTLHRIARSIVNPEADLATRDLDLALKAAESANELTGGQDAGALETLARVQFDLGHVDKAIEFQTRAVKLADGQTKQRLNSTLDEYRKARQ